MVGGMRTMVEKHHNVEHCIDLRPPPSPRTSIQDTITTIPQ